MTTLVRLAARAAVPVLCVGAISLAGFVLARGSDTPTSSSSASTDTCSLASRSLEEWERLYEEATLEQVREETEALRRYMHEATHAYYDARFADGAYELLPAEPDGRRNMPLDDLAAWRWIEGEVAMVRLPRAGFEPVYEARSRITRLMVEEDERLALLEIASLR